MSDLQTTGFGGATVGKSDFRFQRNDQLLIQAHIGFAYLALLLGAVAGVLQTLQRTGVITLPSALGYYQLLTLHGVSLALVFTTFFIIGFLFSGVAKTTGGELRPRERAWGWTGFVLMAAGTVLALIPILTNDASVLYTFYAPLKASPLFYFGLTAVVVGSWSSSVTVFSAFRRWRRAHPGESSPLFAYMAVATMILWVICTLGVAIEMLFQLIPWSMGWTERVDVSLSRTLFWYFGHALVYFWLLPAYIYWYVNIPRLVKGHIFSNSLPRLTFILFILYSIPVGLHHQFNEPGIDSVWKFVQTVLTFFVVIPSFLTAFSLLATFELAGRSQGGKGLLGWFTKLPYKDVRFLAPFLGMILFVPAGIGGIINASYQLNQVVHNTLWVTGHFHLTLASSVVLTFFGISYMLIPVLRGRTLTRAMNHLGIVQAFTWVIGMALMSGGMHAVGLLGEPRRISYTTYGDHPVAQMWIPYRQAMALGGGILFTGIVLFLIIATYLWFFAPKTETPNEYPIGEVTPDQPKPPFFLERWSIWIGVAVGLILFAYTMPFVQLFIHPAPGALPMRTW
ncbi:b(o/a)3-type cytochrome-c oxidase subunit 1 [Brevibacillus sp. WF146]|uniref:b(o/a)3-type cytochrome-c oxidase subunit 1 n=1 Tax=Brevibacillus sp. WF146 TaxID=319501 RepID=UPI0007EC99D6|nr:b(o/a)3-type cytochrome-c oxidase subunit 1 [Brevibacillus sp. WF146]UYZ13874.1 b(o/a)3-type cytochrome-c oxidase subunit 1 [Brevibacillus sp. WF146]